MADAICCKKPAETIEKAADVNETAMSDANNQQIEWDPEVLREFVKQYEMWVEGYYFGQSLFHGMTPLPSPSHRAPRPILAHSLTAGLGSLGPVMPGKDVFAMNQREALVALGITDRKTQDIEIAKRWANIGLASNSTTTMVVQNGQCTAR